MTERIRSMSEAARVQAKIYLPLRCPLLPAVLGDGNLVIRCTLGLAADLLLERRLFAVTMVVSLLSLLNCKIVAFTKTEIWKSDDECEDSILDWIQSESHK
jgi:hypothetical protein